MWSTTTSSSGGPSPVSGEARPPVEVVPERAIACRNWPLAYAILDRGGEAEESASRAVKLGIDTSAMDGAIRELRERR